MRQYTNVETYGNTILVRWAGGDKQKIPFKPSLFVATDKDSEWQTLDGTPALEIQFDSIDEAKQWIAAYEKVDNFEFYGNTNWKQQFLLTTSSEWSEASIKTVMIDIEVAASEGFPDISKANEEILLITVLNRQNKQFVTWGRHPADIPTEYRCFEDERSLLKDFILWWSGNGQPDLVTGWNSEGFDMPYLINRIENVLGEAYVKALSPWKMVRTRHVTISGKVVELKNIVGVGQLDYMDLYKKFIPEGRESFSLDFIAEYELGERKTEHPYNSFVEFYTQDWQLFVEYNVQDVNLVDRLEEKLGLLTVTYNTSYLTKQNYQDVFSPVTTWDNYIHHKLYADKIVIPQTKHNVKEAYQGAYVAEPRKGMKRNVASFDLDSMYPNIIIALNVSPEKYVGKAEFDLDAFIAEPFPIDNGYAVAANGGLFKKEGIGVMPRLVKGVYDTRVEAKTKMKELKLKQDPSLKNDIAALDLQQKSAKLLLNSLYGALANEHFRYSNVVMAEAITLTGQLVIRLTSKMLNEWASNLLGKKSQLVVYNDTDSSYIDLDPFRVKFGLPPEKIEKVAFKVADFLNKSATEVLELINAFDTTRMNFKVEKIASTAFWTGKKKYAMAVVYDEGVVYDTPVVKVTGLEVVRSSTPKEIREWLKEGLRLILTTDEKEVQQYIAQREYDFRQLTYIQAAFPRGVSFMNKWKDGTSLYAKGTPIHVRGAILFNHWIEKKGLTKLYRPIYNGDKIKFIYLKMPNPIRENVISFIDKLPAELGLEKYVDYDRQFEATFLKPLTNILHTLGWKHEDQNTLEDLFS
jgi:DNA polymerase elongation subunit (family B)